MPAQHKAAAGCCHRVVLAVTAYLCFDPAPAPASGAAAVAGAAAATAAAADGSGDSGSDDDDDDDDEMPDPALEAGGAWLANWVQDEFGADLQHPVGAAGSVELGV